MNKLCCVYCLNRGTRFSWEIYIYLWTVFNTYFWVSFLRRIDDYQAKVQNRKRDVIKTRTNIEKLRKDVRVVEGVDLERLRDWAITEGSNPSLSESHLPVFKGSFMTDLQLSLPLTFWKNLVFFSGSVKAALSKVLNKWRTWGAFSYKRK